MSRRPSLNLNITGRISALDLRPDDTIVLQTSQTLLPGQAETMQKLIQAEFPTNNILVMAGDAELIVLTARGELVNAVKAFLAELDAARAKSECGECPPTVATEERLRAALNEASSVKP